MNSKSKLFAAYNKRAQDAYNKRAEDSTRWLCRWGEEPLQLEADADPPSPVHSDDEVQPPATHRTTQPPRGTSSSSLFANRPLKSLLREPEARTVQVHNPTALSEKPNIMLRPQVPSELSSILSKLSILETKVASLEKHNAASFDAVMKAVASASKKNLDTIERGLNVSREDMTTVVDAITKHTTRALQEVADIVSSSQLQRPHDKENSST